MVDGIGPVRSWRCVMASARVESKVKVICHLGDGHQALIGIYIYIIRVSIMG
jgi:hypothetical protein